MAEFLTKFLLAARPLFARRATWCWFVVVFAGVLTRQDWLGVTSVIRALDLNPALYPAMIHFFHASSWKGPKLLSWGCQWLVRQGLVAIIGGRMVLIGDETKNPCEGRKMPLVTTLRQTSETSSKPSYFRGHEWSCLGLLIGANERYFCAPAATALRGMEEAEEPAEGQETSAVPYSARIVELAFQHAVLLGLKSWLVLDAAYGTGAVFKAGKATGGKVCVITRAKSNYHVNILYDGPRRQGRGRPRKFNGRIKLKNLFDTAADEFITQDARIYGHRETVKILARKYYWPPAGESLLFVLAQTSRGPIVLICSDLDADPVTVLELYCRRHTIESMFDRLKNLLGSMNYHFWSAPLDAQTRRPMSNQKERHSANPELTRQTTAATVNFVCLGMLALMFLQAMSCKFGERLTAEAGCWLRTPSPSIPAEFIAKIAVAKIIKGILCGLASNPITEIIRRKQKKTGNEEIGCHVA